MKKIIGFILIAFSIAILTVIVFALVSSSGTNAVSGESSSVANPANYVVFSPGASFITNIKDSNKYLKISIVFELRSAKSMPYYESNNYKIRDVIIDVLRNKTEGELSQEGAQENLKHNIKEALGSHIDVSDLMNVYVEEFVIQ